MYTAADPQPHPHHGTTSRRAAKSYYSTQKKSQSNRSTRILKAHQMHKKHTHTPPHTARRGNEKRTGDALSNARTQIVWKVRKKFQKKKKTRVCTTARVCTPRWTPTPRHRRAAKSYYFTQNKSQSNRSTRILKAHQMHHNSKQAHTDTHTAPRGNEKCTDKAFKPNARTQIVWKVRKKVKKKKKRRVCTR
jgi:uncharacterized cupredoxin-like copper-binding protein